MSRLSEYSGDRGETQAEAAEAKDFPQIILKFLALGAAPIVSVGTAPALCKPPHRVFVVGIRVAIPPAFLRLLERSPDALRVFHSIPRPRTMGYIRSGAVNIAPYAWIS
jgi:hypothetical protein